MSESIDMDLPLQSTRENISCGVMSDDMNCQGDRNWFRSVNSK